jgi:hypothetical protein
LPENAKMTKKLLLAIIIKKADFMFYIDLVIQT